MQSLQVFSQGVFDSHQASTPLSYELPEFNFHTPQEPSQYIDIASKSSSISPPATKDRTRVREGRCWHCTNDHQKCEPSSDPLLCQRCKDRKYTCLNDGPGEAKRRKLTHLKCQQCRQKKQKCEPDNRQWPGQKCRLCTMQNLPCSEPQRAPVAARRTKATKSRRTIRMQSSHSEEPTELDHQILDMSYTNLAPLCDDHTAAFPADRECMTPDTISSRTEDPTASPRNMAGGIHPDGIKDFTDVQTFIEQHEDVDEYPDWVLRECLKRLGMLKQLAHCVAALHLRERSTEAIDISEKVAAALITRHRYMEAEKLYRNMISLLLSTPEDRFVLWHYNRTKLETLVASFASILENNGEVAAAIELYEDLFAFWDKSSPGYIRGLDQATPHIIRLYRQFSVELTLKPDDCFLPLHRALELRSPALANAILDSKYPTDGRNFKEQTALHLVAKTNEPGKEKHFLALANRLLDGGCDLEARDNEDRTPLFIASQYGAVQMVSLLLEKGASPSELGNYSSSRWAEPIPMTSLHVASICGHESVALHLLYEIPSIDDFRGLNEVLYYASKSGLYDAVTLLLEMGVDVDTTWKWRFYPNPNNLLVFENALSCAVYGGYRALAELLLCKSARSVAEYSGLFGFAIEGKNDQILRWLLTINANYDEHYIIYDEEEEEGEDDEYRYPETALQHACRTGWIRGVQILLQARVDSNQAPHEQEGRTALQAACENGHETIVRMLLNAGSTVYDHLSKKQHGLTALQAASKNGHDQIVGLLLEAGFPLEMYSSSDEEGECWRNTTALQLACGAGHEIVVRLLVKAGANINAPPPPLEFGKTALQAACSGGQGSIVRLLLQLGADINAPPAPKSGTTALQAACNSGHKSIAKLLLEYGADINAPPAAKDGLTALQAACWGGRESIVKLLLQLGADVNAHPAAEDGMTALQAACRGGYESIVKLLLQSGADINAPLVTKDGETALQAACRCGHISIVKLLLQLEADANAPPAVAYGMTALQAACYSGNESIVKLLLQLGADVNALPAAEYGKTALQVACYCGHESIVKLLLQLGADINAPPVARGGRTALQAACWGGHEPVTKLLLQFGADVNALPAANNGDSALQAACFRGHESIAKLLLQFGADVNAPPAAHFGQTALQAAKYYACTCGGKSVSSLVKLLKNAGAIK